MSWLIALALGLGLLLGLLLMGVRIFAAFLIVNLTGTIWLIGPMGIGLFVNSLFETATSPTLASVALFILMGELLFRSGALTELFDSVDRLVGKLPGRLYVVVIALSALFGAMSGSAVAVAVMLGSTAMPLMQARGYDQGLSASTILAGASLAPVIPPSLVAIVVGSLADVSIAELLVAGVVPGLILGGISLAWVMFMQSRHTSTEVVSNTPANPTTEPSGEHSSVARSILRMAPFLVVIAAVLGLMLAGIASPSESAAMGVLGALMVAAVFRRLDKPLIFNALSHAALTTSVLLIIVASAKLFSQLLSFSGATRGIVQLATSLELGPDLMLVVLLIIPFVLCMFIDQFAYLLLAIPIYKPIVLTMGYDPIWFWTLFVIILTIGSLTPPLGYTLFALRASSPTLPTTAVYQAAWPVVSIFISGIVLFWAFPSLVTFLPGLLR